MQPAVCSLRARAVRPCHALSAQSHRRCVVARPRQCRRAGGDRRNARVVGMVDWIDLIEPFVRFSESVADGSILEPASLRGLGAGALESGALYAAYSLAVRVKNQLDEQNRLQAETGGPPPPRKIFGITWGGDDSDSDEEEEEGEEGKGSGASTEAPGLVFDVVLMSLILWSFVTGVLFYTGWVRPITP